MHNRFYFEQGLSAHGRYRLYWLMELTYRETFRPNHHLRDVLLHLLSTYIKRSNVDDYSYYFEKLYQEQLKPLQTTLDDGIIIDPKIFLNYLFQKNRAKMWKLFNENILNTYFEPPKVITYKEGNKTYQVTTEQVIKIDENLITQEWIELVDNELFYDPEYLKSLNQNVSDEDLLNSLDFTKEQLDDYSGENPQTPAKNILNNFLKDAFVKYISEENKIKIDNHIIKKWQDGIQISDELEQRYAAPIYVDFDY